MQASEPQTLEISASPSRLGEDSDTLPHNLSLVFSISSLLSTPARVPRPC